MLVIASSLILVLSIGKIAINQQSRLAVQFEKISDLKSSNKKLMDELNTTYATIGKYESIAKLILILLIQWKEDYKLHLKQ